MAIKKLYKIYCETEADWIHSSTIADDAPTVCPNDAGHTVTNNSSSIEELIELNNLEATTNPTSNDDVNEGYIVGSIWINTTNYEVFKCVSNAAGNAVWEKTSEKKFGMADAEDADGSLKTTTDTANYTLALSLNPTCIAGAKYRIGWNYEVKNATNGGWVDSKVYIGGAIEAVDFEVKKWFAHKGGFKYVTPGAGSLLIEIKFRADTQGTAEMQRVRLEFWRVS